MDDATGVGLRAALVNVDYANLGLFEDGPWDNGDPDYLTRQELYDALLNESTGNPDMYITEYTDIMETSLGSDSGVKCFTETGPTGAEDYWDAEADEEPYNSTGDPVSDWWGRASNGDKVEAWGTSFLINITDWVTVDASGRRYPQWRGDRVIDEILYVTTPKTGAKGSLGVYGDVMIHHANKSSVDWDGDGVNEDADDDWDDDGPGEEAATKWRAGHIAYFDRIRETYASINGVGNWTRHVEGSGDSDNTDMSFLPVVYDEYYMRMAGGHVQNNSLPSPRWPHSGVLSDGTQRDPKNASDNWQRVANAHVQTLLASTSPNLCSMDWRVVLDDHFDPTSAGSVMNLARWGLGTVLVLGGGFFYLNSNSSNYRKVPLLDETGLINTGTTGLSKGWLGYPIDDPQRTPQQSTNIWWREFDNGLVILNTDGDDAASATTVTFANLPGDNTTWKRIDGSQDSSWNDGSNVTANFNLPPIDCIILERR